MVTPQPRTSSSYGPSMSRSRSSTHCGSSGRGRSQLSSYRGVSFMRPLPARHLGSCGCPLHSEAGVGNGVGGGLGGCLAIEDLPHVHHNSLCSERMSSTRLFPSCRKAFLFSGRMGNHHHRSVAASNYFWRLHRAFHCATSSHGKKW